MSSRVSIRSPAKPSFCIGFFGGTEAVRRLLRRSPAAARARDRDRIVDRGRRASGGGSEVVLFQRAELSRMQAGRLLIRAGRLEHARAFLEEARSGQRGRAKSSGSSCSASSRCALACRSGQRSVLRRFSRFKPGLTRVRLELASAYYLLGRDDKARHHFGASLADPLPSSVEDRRRRVPSPHRRTQALVGVRLGLRAARDEASGPRDRPDWRRAVPAERRRAVLLGDRRVPRGRGLLLSEAHRNASRGARRIGGRKALSRLPMG